MITRDDDHRYWVETPNGVVNYPGVSEILKDVGFSSSKINWNPHKTQLGTDVHKYCEDLDRGLKPDIPDEAKGYVRAYKKWLKEMNVKILEVELFINNDDFEYAGQLDRVAIVNGVKSIVDLKTGVEAKLHGVQLNAYAFAYEQIHEDKTPLTRAGLYLRETGKYKYKTYNDPADLQDFVAACRVFHRKKKL